MDAEQVFRFILIAWFAATFPIALFFRLRSQSTGEKLDRRQEGVPLMVALRLLGALFALLLLAWLVNPPWLAGYLAWSSWPAPAALRWVGVGLLPVGGGLGIWTFRTLGRNLTDTVVTRKEHTLVVTGPYRYVRHPFYAAGFLGMAALSLVTADWLLPLVGGAVLALLVIRTRIEEQKLIERFGDAYRDYMRRTGRFFPRAGRAKSPPATARSSPP